jgi:hypothetical protein
MHGGGSGHGVHYDEMTRSVLGEDASSRYLGRYVKLSMHLQLEKIFMIRPSRRRIGYRNPPLPSEEWVNPRRLGGQMQSRCPCRVDSVMARD